MAGRPANITPNPITAVLSEEDLLAAIDPARLPRHVAIIMDGNRRWAKARNLPGFMGHRAGITAFRRVLEACRRLDIPTLSVYAFSLENWRRSSTEVNLLMSLFEHYCKREREELLRTGIRFRVIGRTDNLPSRVQGELFKTLEATSRNDRMNLNLCVNYGARNEILKAVRELAIEAAAGRLDPAQIDDAMFSAHLYTAGQEDPDLLIRTSGELRISNFLLWQCAYTEFWFTDKLWPDFGQRELYEAIVAFQRRERRFGGGAPPPPPPPPPNPAIGGSAV